MNQDLERPSLSERMLGHDKGEGAARHAQKDDHSGASNLTLFIVGMLTALALWWLYLRPASTERKSRSWQARARPKTASGPLAAAAPQRLEWEEAPSAVAIEPEAPVRDDLTRILGIGPARAARLIGAGITTFAALAVADAEQLRDILAGVRVAHADMSSWPEQASLAAKGDWVGLTALQARLRAARG